MTSTAAGADIIAMSSSSASTGPRPDFDELTGDFSAEYEVPELMASELLEIMRQPASDSSLSTDSSSSSRNDALLLFDVRTAQEQSVSSMPGAIRIQPGESLRRRPEYSAFRGNHGPDALCVVFCTGGKRSAIAAAEALGVDEQTQGQADKKKESDVNERILNLRGGLIAYANLGGELEHPEKGTRTSELHGYNEKWAAYIEAPVRAMLEPPVPVSTTMESAEQETSEEQGEKNVR